jgi:hypothetical protein
MTITLQVDSRADALEIIARLLDASAHCQHKADQWGAKHGDNDAVDIELRRQAAMFRSVSKQIGKQLKTVKA